MLGYSSRCVEVVAGQDGWTAEVCHWKRVRKRSVLSVPRPWGQLGQDWGQGGSSGDPSSTTHTVMLGALHWLLQVCTYLLTPPLSTGPSRRALMGCSVTVP